MTDISGKLFIGIDAVIKRGNHSTHRNRKTADFIRARGKIWDADPTGRQFARVTFAPKFSRGGQIGKRVGDG